MRFILSRSKKHFWGAEYKTLALLSLASKRRHKQQRSEALTAGLSFSL